MALNTVPHFVGYFLTMITYLDMEPVIFKSLLIVGRSISGIGLGWSLVVVPVSYACWLILVCYNFIHL